MNIINCRNWTPFVGSDQYKVFASFVDQLIAIDDSCINTWVKWKSYSKQVVVQSDKFFYKLYQEDLQYGEFICAIRERLAELYANEYGIHQHIKTFKTEQGYVQIEQREKLQVCDDSMRIEDILIGQSKTLDKLESKLNLKLIEYQIRQVMPNVKRIKLVRDCISKQSDYAIKNNVIVLLDDADWFLALLDENNNQLSPQYNYYPIEYNGKTMVFAPQDFLDDDLMCKVGSSKNKQSVFQLPSTQNTNVQNIDNLFAKREQAIADVIKLIATKDLTCLSGRQIYTQQQSNWLLK